MVIDGKGRFLVFGNKIRIVIAPLRSGPLLALLDVSMSLYMFQPNPRSPVQLQDEVLE
jgi:hypothetical protein